MKETRKQKIARQEQFARERAADRAIDPIRRALDSGELVITPALRSLPPVPMQEMKDQDSRVDSSSFANSPDVTTAGSNEVSPTLLNACSIEALRHMRDALQTYAEWCGGVHDDLCPEDDTCDCSVKWVNDGVNATVRFLEGLENLRKSPVAGRVADAGPAGDDPRAADPPDPAFLNSSTDWWHFPGGQPA